MRLHRVVMAALLTALVPFLAACGGSSNNAAEPLPTTPTLTVPGESKTPTVDTTTSGANVGTTTTTTPATTTTTPAATTTQSNPSTPQGGAAPPQTGGATPTQQTTTSPPANSPASKFEQFCKENPGAC